MCTRALRHARARARLLAKQRDRSISSGACTCTRGYTPGRNPGPLIASRSRKIPAKCRRQISTFNCAIKNANMFNESFLATRFFARKKEQNSKVARYAPRGIISVHETDGDRYRERSVGGCRNPSGSPCTLRGFVIRKKKNRIKSDQVVIKTIRISTAKSLRQLDRKKKKKKIYIPLSKLNRSVCAVWFTLYSAKVARTRAAPSVTTSHISRETLRPRARDKCDRGV